MQGGPLMHIIAAKAVCLHEAMQPQFRDYAEAVIRNCKVMADKLQAGGLRIVSGGSDNHLLLVDVKAASASAARKLRHCSMKPASPAIRIRSPLIRKNRS